MSTGHSYKEQERRYAAHQMAKGDKPMQKPAEEIEVMSEFDCIQRGSCIELDAPWCVCDRASRI